MTEGEEQVGGEPVEGHKSWITALFELHDGRVVSTSDDGSIRLWDPESGMSIKPVALRGCIHTAVPLSGGQIVSDNGNDLYIWSPEASAGDSLVGHEATVVALTVLTDGRIASGSMDPTLRIWNIGTDKPAVVLRGHRGPVRAVITLPDGRIVSASDDCALRIWNPSTGHHLKTLEGHESGFWSIACLPDGRIVSASSDYTLRVWDADSGESLQTLRGHKGGLLQVIVLTKGLTMGMIASASLDGSVRVWDPSSGRQIAVCEGHRSRVDALAELPSGEIASVSEDKTLRLWYPDSGIQRAIVYGEAAFCRVIAAAKTLVVAGDALGNVWFIDTQDTVP